MSTRTILIIVNLVAIVGVLGFIVSKVVSLRGTRRARPPTTSRRSTATTCSRAWTSARAGVSLIAPVIVVIGLLAYFIWEPFREASAKTSFKDRSIERGAVLFANNQSKEYDSTKSLLCAKLPRRRRRRRLGPVRGQERRPGMRSLPGRQRRARREATRVPAPPGVVAAPQPPARAAPVQPPAAHPDHHVRAPGHADAGVGCAERQGRAPGAEHPGPRQLRPEPQHHERQGAGHGRGGDARDPQGRTEVGLRPSERPWPPRRTTSPSCRRRRPTTRRKLRSPR